MAWMRDAIANHPPGLPKLTEDHQNQGQRHQGNQQHDEASSNHPLGHDAGAGWNAEHGAQNQRQPGRCTSQVLQEVLALRVRRLASRKPDTDVGEDDEKRGELHGSSFPVPKRSDARLVSLHRF